MKKSIFFADLQSNQETVSTLKKSVLVSERSQDLGFAWASLGRTFQAVRDEVDELSAELFAPAVDWQKVCEELGDVVFTIGILTAFLKKQYPAASNLDLDEVTEQTLQKFMARFAALESLVEAQGIQLNEENLKKIPYTDLKTYWEKVKQSLKKDN